ncbi:MAG: helix-turn-helix transcriptional regulator [bacterium]|nr:helix-turn-helix transcriptional regulator [bacterium]
MGEIISEVLILFYWAGFALSVVLLIALSSKRILGVLVNRMLFALVLSISTILLFILSYMTESINIHRQWNGVAMLAWFCIGPLLYFYVKARSQYSYKLRWLYVLFFFLPIYELYEITVSIFELPISSKLLFTNKIVYSHWLSATYTLQNIIFAVLSIVCLNNYEKNKSTALIAFFYGIIVSSILFFVNGLYFGQEPFIGFLQQVMTIVYTSMIHYFGISAIRNSSTLNRNEPKYQNINLSKADSLNLASQLEKAMVEEKLYLKHDLSLSELASKLGVQENALSKLFSDHLGTGFYEYLKRYRLEEFELNSRKPEYRHQKIAAIAMDSGFKSRTTFYTAFKEKHGISPSDYMKAEA